MCWLVRSFFSLFLTVPVHHFGCVYAVHRADVDTLLYYCTVWNIGCIEPLAWACTTNVSFPSGCLLCGASEVDLKILEVAICPKSNKNTYKKTVAPHSWPSCNQPSRGVHCNITVSKCRRLPCLRHLTYLTTTRMPTPGDSGVCPLYFLWESQVCPISSSSLFINRHLSSSTTSSSGTLASFVGAPFLRVDADTTPESPRNRLRC